MKKILYNLVAAMAVLSIGMFCSCSEDNDGFITATEDDFPQILLPWFGEWENGEPAVYKNISRDIEFIDSVTVTPALYTTVEWLIDDEKIHEGTKIQHTFLAGEYVLKIIATTTKGKSTFRTGKLIVWSLDSDPIPGNDIRDRQVVAGQSAKLHGVNMDKVVKIAIGGKEATTTFVENGNKSYVKYTVPADLALGTYRITLTDSDGNVYGGDKIVVSDEAPAAEETLWEGEFNVTWDTPFNLLQTQFKDLVKAGDIVRVYVTGEGQGTMTTGSWNNILTGKGDPERDDIMINGSMSLEFTLTDFSMEIMNEQEGAIFVGNGYTITEITKIVKK
ncbi:hypothetical protein [Bacteroides finegoldii]|jgi:hypothetical protein|uniref:hypothetical protein n=1 Tax=Bacteroides finegoldii TaxID=338188 RepID=UPI00234C463E|nr:hypothetical protein [Bacteroides finegoldii]MDC7140507.1 hypothetical protein [Bacteroides finegoldii]